MKKIKKIAVQAAILIIALTTIYSSRSFAFSLAFPTPDEMRANYDICMNSDESWYRRFGQYIVAFDIYAATEACRSVFYHTRTHLAACRSEGRWIYAGYYCEEISGNKTKK